MASGTTTTWGRPYPTSSDAPNVHSDIQALANSLEKTPLYPTTATASRSGLAGESAVISPSQTFTLPASPTKGDILRAVALGTVTGATQVVVAAAGGKVINGQGLSGASSFTLGTPWSHATLQYDGTNWLIIDGEVNTGWVGLTLASGISLPPSGVYNPQVRVRGDEGKLRGWLKNTSGGNIGTNTLVATAPVGYRPANQVPLYVSIWNSVGGSNVTYATLAYMDTAGAIRFNDNHGETIGINAYLALDNNSYPLT